MELEDNVCPVCGKWIPERDRRNHEKGRDTKRLECPHQDLEEVAAAAEAATSDWADRVW